VLAHEPLDGARLVAAEVVDVEIRVGPEPLVDEVHDGLEGPALPGAVMRPYGLIPWFLRILGEDAEQELEASRGLEEGVAFQIEEDVTG
jgi:hypothetical protein